MAERIFVHIYYAFLDPRFLYKRCMKTENATIAMLNVLPLLSKRSRFCFRLPDIFFSSDIFIVS